MLVLPVAIPGSLAASLAIQAPMLAAINKSVGFRLVTKFGTKGVVNLAKFVPPVGGLVGRTFDGMTCYVAGQAADRVFRPTLPRDDLEAGGDAAVTTLEALIDTAVALSDCGAAPRGDCSRSAFGRAVAGRSGGVTSGLRRVARTI